MRVGGAWLEHAGTQAALAMLDRAGHAALLVGGCVRNALMGQEVDDIDIATDAPPERVLELARAAGLHGVPTGIEHGTVTVVAEGQAHEITTFRRDVETFGRHATVAYATTAGEDAHRRDFTVNALYARADGQVLDPLGSGLADLAARRIRFIDDAEDRIREDYLRILRFFRFTAWYGDPALGPEPEGLAACAALSGGIETLSRERVGAEMRKLLAAPDPSPAVGSMAQAGVLAATLPGAGHEALARLVHFEPGLGLSPEPVRRLAALTPPDAAELLRLSRSDARRLEALLAAARSTAGPGELGYRLGDGGGRDALALRAAFTELAPPVDAAAAVARGAGARFPVSAADLMPAYEGPALGARLRELEARWIASGFAASRDELLA